MSQGPRGTVVDMQLADFDERTEPGLRPGATSPRPFRFSRLEQIPREQLEAMKRVQWMLPDGLLSGGTDDAVRQRLKGIFDAEVSLGLEYVHSVAPKELAKLIPAATVLGVLSPSPHATRGLVEMELGLAHAIIDQLLGANEASLVRPLTDIENGVIAYVLLEAFKAITPPGSEQGRNRLRLEGILASVEEGLELLQDESAVAVVELKAGVGVSSGYIRLILPASSVNHAVPPEASPSRRARRLKHLQSGLHRLAGIKAQLRIEIGGVELTGSDLSRLRPGDVMLLDQLTLKAHRGESGTGWMRVGLGRRGRIAVSLEAGEGHYRARVEAVELGQPPQSAKPHEPAAGPAAPEHDEYGLGELRAAAEKSASQAIKTSPGGSSPWDDEDEKTVSVSKPEEVQADAAELLNDVPLQVVVELGRLPITAEELVALHAGKVLELGKKPGDPVELSVNGKVVAHGELVEIEGQLGVRISTLAG